MEKNTENYEKAENYENDEIVEYFVDLDELDELEESDTSDKWSMKDSIIFYLVYGLIMVVIFGVGSIKLIIVGSAYGFFMKWLLKKFSE